MTAKQKIYFITAAGIILVSFSLTSGMDPQPRDEEIHNQQISQGQVHYNLIVKDSRLPKYGKCWRDALQNLEAGCKHLTDDVQSRLALEFANCFLEKSGLETYQCDRKSTIKSCLESISNNGFTAYTNFFTHTQSMCYFLQSQIWNEETHLTINRLSENSVKVQQQLENSSEKQQLILQSQLTSLAKQQELLDKSLNLRKALDTSKETVQLMLQDFKISTNEQRHILFETFDRVAKLQNVVLGEMSGIYSFMFYPTALLVSYLLTSTARTSAARFWIFTVFSCSFGIERLVTNWSLYSSPHSAADEASDLLYGRVWLVRKVAMLLCVACLSYFALTFRDLNLVNNALLEDIRRQNLELKQFLLSSGHGFPKTGTPFPFSSDVTDSILAEEDDEFSSNSDSDTSFDSQATDRTYIQNAEWLSSDSEREESFSAGRVSTGGQQLQRSKNTRKPKEVGHDSIASPSRSPYNLRNRKNVQLKDFLDNESPENFTKTVRRMARISRRNADRVLQALNQKKECNQTFFSSDEE